MYLTFRSRVHTKAQGFLLILGAVLLLAPLTLTAQSKTPSKSAPKAPSKPASAPKTMGRTLLLVRRRMGRTQTRQTARILQMRTERRAARALRTSRRKAAMPGFPGRHPLAASRRS